MTIVSENPVYVQGDWNANAGNNGFDGAHAATSIIADAVTLLSGAWNDTVSFTQPYTSGEPPSCRGVLVSHGHHRRQRPGVPATGRCGGRFRDRRGRAQLPPVSRRNRRAETVNYRGSIATFFFNRQAVGTYKCCATVYGAPTRAYAFDIEFLQPALLPPNTPVFRDMNAVGFAQEMRPGR